MKTYKRIVALASALTLLAAQPTLAARGPGVTTAGGPGVSGETAGYGQSTEVRRYPGWNGSGYTGPISGYSCDEDYDFDDEEYNVFPQGWRYSPSGWWYQYSDGGWPSNGWKYIDGRWYYLNINGHLMTGWFTEGDKKYYLNPVDDGTLGMMRIGWQIVDGKAYYFNTMSGGPLGAMLVNTTTPDGYKVGADGVMVQ